MLTAPRRSMMDGNSTEELIGIGLGAVMFSYTLQCRRTVRMSPTFRPGARWDHFFFVVVGFVAM